jgi:hypothetical protein
MKTWILSGLSVTALAVACSSSSSGGTSDAGNDVGAHDTGGGHLSGTGSGSKEGACGGQGQPCCTGNTCNEPNCFSCFSGTCMYSCGGGGTGTGTGTGSGTGSGSGSDAGSDSGDSGSHLDSGTDSHSHADTGVDSGFDAAGCPSSCTATCMSCDNALTGEPNGFCAPVELGNTDPNGGCTAGPPNGCGYTGYCNGNGACQETMFGQACGVASCTNAIETPVGTCDGMGTCEQTPTPCAPFSCDGTACATM